MGYTDITLHRVMAAINHLHAAGHDASRPGPPSMPVINLVTYLCDQHGITRNQARTAIKAAVDLKVITVGTGTDRHGDQRLKYATLTPAGLATVRGSGHKDLTELARTA